MVEAAHSSLGASSMYRWAACPGSVREAAKAPKSAGSSYAEEGSDAHALAAMILREGGGCMQYVKLDVQQDGRKFHVSYEMAEAVQTYIDAVRECLQSDQDLLTVEQRFDLSAVHPGCFGTADAVIWQPHSKLLTVIDYKHGAGIPVEVKDNPQLRYYALGALLASNYPAARVKMVIVQPRCDHPDGPVREDEIDAIDLIDFSADLKRYALATEVPDAPLHSGDHCRFCPARRDCPEILRHTQAFAVSEFSPALSYDPAKLAATLETLDAIETRAAAIREFAYAEAEAGRFVGHGWKLVAKRARRKWRDEAETEKLLLGRGMAPDDLYEPRAIKSPAQMEKVLAKDAVAPLVISESSGHVLVPESDRRPAVTRATPQEEFQPVADPLALPDFLKREPKIAEPATIFD